MYTKNDNIQDMIDRLINGANGSIENILGLNLRSSDGANYSRRVNELWDQLMLHMANKTPSSGNNHWGIRESDFPDGYEGIIEYINNNIDLDVAKKNGQNFLENYFDSLMAGKHWNESIAKLADYYYKIFKDDAGDTEIDSTYITLNDLRHADAANSFAKNKNWVRPWMNIDENNYSSVRNNDKIIRVLTDNKNLQFTQQQHPDLNQYLRLIMPEYKRIVEVEDLNRNFWVIGQALTALCAFLFDDDSPLPSLLSALLDEIAQLWENIFFLWLILSLLSYKQPYEDIVTVFLPIANDLTRPFVKFDDFNYTEPILDGAFVTIESMTPDQLKDLLEEIWENRQEYLKDKYNNCAVVFVPEIRMENYAKNYYAKVAYPGIIVYDDSLENTDDWVKFLPFDYALVVNLKDKSIYHGGENEIPDIPDGRL